MSGSFSSGLLDSLAHPAQVNYLDVVNKSAYAANLINEARKTQAQQLAGEAFQRSINPDGTPNQNALLSNLAGAGPGAALAAQSSAQAGQTLDSGTLTTHLTRLAAMNQAAIALWAQHGGVVPQEALNDEIDTQGAKLGFSPTDIAQAKTQFGPDPVANGQTILRNLNTNLTTQQALAASLKPTGTMDTGQSTVGTAGVAPMSGQPVGPVTPVGPATATGLPSRTTLGSKVSWTDTQGVQHDGTWEQYSNDRNSGLVTEDPLVTPPGGGPAKRVPGGNPLLGDLPGAGNAPQGGGGGPPAAPGATPAPAAPAAPPAPSAKPPAPTRPGLTSTTGPAPGVVPATEQTGRDMASMGSALVARGDQAPTNKANYGSMLSDLSQLNSMGPGAEREKALNAFAIRWTGKGVTMSPAQVAAADSFGKLANIIVGQQLSAIGGTDARQSLFMGSNPHLDLSKLGNEQILHMLQGNEDAIQAKSRAWQHWILPTARGGLGNPASSYGEFQDDFNHHFDPRVFQQQYMGTKEIADLRAGLNGPGALQKFKDDTQYARDQGWIR